MTDATTILASIDDYLLGETQVTSFVIMHQLQGTIDGTVPTPSFTVLVAHGITQPNPAYSY